MATKTYDLNVYDLYIYRFICFGLPNFDNNGIEFKNFVLKFSCNFLS